LENARNVAIKAAKNFSKEDMDFLKQQFDDAIRFIESKIK
jgi:hypothetical protein